ncbi:MAG: RecX family transcriptional regulator [Prevotellaceae bacterium]|jgi:regulatory protein|nr:RecX family transcriptional regulator [Prevotellaceae bacterium]
MPQELTYEQALHRAAALCTASEKCSADINEKLLAWGINPSDAEKIIDYLTKEKFLDDARFAHAFVRDKFRFNKWGRQKIAFALKMKNISPALIADALAEIDSEVYCETLVELLRAKQRGMKFKNDADRRAKLYRFALSRGFELSAVGEVWKRL